MLQPTRPFVWIATLLAAGTLYAGPLTIDSKQVAIQKDGLAFVTLAVGSHTITCDQFANDGNVGVVLTMDKAPPDPADNARRFTNEYLHQWMPPLGDGH